MARRILNDTTECDEPDDVAHALNATMRGVRRLVELLGDDMEDQVEKASEALVALGAKATFFVLTRALLGAPDPLHRLEVVSILVGVAREAPDHVAEILRVALGEEQDAIVAKRIELALAHLVGTDPTTTALADGGEGEGEDAVSK